MSGLEFDVYDPCVWGGGEARGSGKVEGKGRKTLKATWKREFRPLWREAGPPTHLENKVVSDLKVVNK